jgi:hypothetical protein
MAARRRGQDAGSGWMDGPSRVIASGNFLLVLAPPLEQHVFSLCLRGVRPEALSGVQLRHNVPDLRELFFPEGMTVLPGTLCENLRRLGRVVFPGAPVLTEVGWYAFLGCCSLRSLLLPTTMRIIGLWAFDGAAIERMNLLEVHRVQRAHLDGMTRVKFLAFGRSVNHVSFAGAASVRSLTFGRISGQCGGHPVEARCLTLKGRFPRSLESVLRETHLFAELCGAANRVSSPMTPP